MKRGAHPKGAEPPQTAPAASIHDTNSISFANGWMWQGLAIIVGILVVIAVIYKLYSSRTTAKKTIEAKPTDAKEAEKELVDSCSESSSILLHTKDNLELAKRASHKGYDEATDDYHQTDSTPVDKHQTVPQTPTKTSSIPQGDVSTAKLLDIQEHKDSFQLKGTDTYYSDAYEIALSSSEDQRLAAGEHKESHHKPERSLKNDTEIISEGTGEHTVAVVTEDIKAGESKSKGEDTLSSTSKILKEEKRSVGKSLRKFWKSKKGAVVTKSKENVTEGTSIIASISSEVSDTTHTTVDRSEVLQQPVLDTSTIPKAKRRKSSVGEVFKKIWNPKKGMVDSNALENRPEDNYIDDGLPSQEPGTEITKIESSVTFATDTLREEGQKATSSHMTLKHLGNESEKVVAIDDISTKRPSSADVVAKGSISCTDDQESLHGKISQESKTAESFLRADQSQENEEATLTPKALKDETRDASIAPAERRKSSLADAIDWLWNLTTTEAETTRLEPLTEEGPVTEDLPSEDTRTVDVETESGIQPESHTIHIKMDSTVSMDKVEATHTRKTSVIKPTMLSKTSDAINEVPSTSTSEDLQRKEMECIERSSSAKEVSKDSVKLVEDKEHIHSMTTDTSHTTRAEDVVVEKDIHGEASQEPEQPEEEDITVQASEPETTTENLEITKSKRRKSSVAEALRKIWNPKKGPVDTQSRENLAEEVSTNDNIDVQTKDDTDVVNEASDSEFHLESRKRSMNDTKVHVISSTSISSRKESLSSNRALAKDIDLESQESEKTIEEPEGETKNVESESEIQPEFQKRSTTEVRMGLNLSFDKGEHIEIEDAIEPIMFPHASLVATNEASRTNMLNEREGNSCDQLKGQHEDFGTSDGSSSSYVAVDRPDDKLPPN